MNLQAIYPPLPAQCLPNACTSCQRDVHTDRGFVDLDGTPRKSYYCARCANLCVPRSGMTASLIQEAQDRYRNSMRAAP